MKRVHFFSLFLCSYCIFIFAVIGTNNVKEAIERNYHCFFSSYFHCVLARCLTLHILCILICFGIAQKKQAIGHGIVYMGAAEAEAATVPPPPSQQYK